MKLDVKSSKLIVFGIESNDKNPKFEVGDHVRISKYKKKLHKITFQVGLKNFL